MREYGSEQPAINLPDDYFVSLSRFNREITYLRCGREALLYVSKNCCDSENNIILMPSYCCWSMSAPFKKSGWDIVYYRLNDDLTIDEIYFQELLERCNPKAVLTMNYYGSSSTKSAIKRIKCFNSNIIIIEDFSHCTFCLSSIFNDNVDYYVSSIRKQLGISDGAIVLSKCQTDSSLIKKNKADFGDIRFSAQTEKGRYSYDRDEKSKECFLKSLRGCEQLIDNFRDIHPISERGKKQLQSINGEEIAYARRVNMRHLWYLLKEKVEMVPGLERGFDGAPFALPILVDNQLDVQRRLAKRGVYTQVLWPIFEKAQKVCPVSKKMGEKMLSVPIDQRYNWDDIEDIASIIIDVLK